MPDTNDPKTTSPGDGATAVLDDLEALRARVRTAEEERGQLVSLLQRTQADFENYQKRAQRDMAQEKRYWYAPLVLDLLPVLDNLERATEAAKQAGETGPLVQGVALTQSQLYDILRRHNITRIDAEGQPFDPNVHQAVMQQPSDQPPGTVLRVLQQGFKLHDRVLRPATVIVSAAKE